jgi:diguanylate cyclase
LLSVEGAYKGTHCLIMLDIDHFKRVNDTHGHVMGDRVIQTLGEILRTCVTLPGHVAARYGGEEFAVLLPNSEIEYSMRLAASLRLKAKSMVIRDRRKAQSPPVAVTISLGVTALLSGDDALRFIARADAALYKSKQGGRDRVTFC